MSKETGGPAFPIWHETSVCASGMSIRDHFAGLAMSVAWAALEAGYFDADSESAAKRLAECSYQMADAMLEARNK